jgi:hypothetical protein
MRNVRIPLQPCATIARRDMVARMRQTTDVQQALLGQLANSDYINPKQILVRTSSQFVRDYGWFYTPAPLPKGVPLGTKAECYNNALKLALDNPNFTYVEGFAIGRGGVRIHHAWVTDGTGRAIDNTWNRPGLVYAGVPFKTEFVTLIGLTNDDVGSLIDDWEHEWPLLNARGDHPEQWLEPKGNGSRKLT